MKASETKASDMSLEGRSLKQLKRMQETAKNIVPATPEELRKAALKQHHVASFNKSSSEKDK